MSSPKYTPDQILAAIRALEVEKRHGSPLARARTPEEIAAFIQQEVAPILASRLKGPQYGLGGLENVGTKEAISPGSKAPRTSQIKTRRGTKTKKLAGFASVPGTIDYGEAVPVLGHLRVAKPGRLEAFRRVIQALNLDQYGYPVPAESTPPNPPYREFPTGERGPHVRVSEYGHPHALAPKREVVREGLGAHVGRLTVEGKESRAEQLATTGSRPRRFVNYMEDYMPAAGTVSGADPKVVTRPELIKLLDEVSKEVRGRKLDPYGGLMRQIEKALFGKPVGGAAVSMAMPMPLAPDLSAVNKISTETFGKSMNPNQLFRVWSYLTSQPPERVAESLGKLHQAFPEHSPAALSRFAALVTQALNVDEDAGKAAKKVAQKEVDRQAIRARAQQGRYLRPTLKQGIQPSGASLAKMSKGAERLAPVKARADLKPIFDELTHLGLYQEGVRMLQKQALGTPETLSGVKTMKPGKRGVRGSREKPGEAIHRATAYGDIGLLPEEMRGFLTDPTVGSAKKSAAAFTQLKRLGIEAGPTQPFPSSDADVDRLRGLGRRVQTIIGSKGTGWTEASILAAFPRDEAEQILSRPLSPAGHVTMTKAEIKKMEMGMNRVAGERTGPGQAGQMLKQLGGRLGRYPGESPAAALRKLARESLKGGAPALLLMLLPMLMGGLASGLERGNTQPG